ncbi:MAG TPA: zinc ribbon domain-containing protein [Thermoanaerobaculia bacterium]|nr:zinc ribbon domain-containing protein [Thermoanaerobaculia bacterium]
MPLYEYRCRDCGNQFEILQRLGAGAAGLTCTGCGAAALDKQFSTFATTGGAGDDAMAAAGCEAPDCGAGAGDCCGGGCSWDSVN